MSDVIIAVIPAPGHEGLTADGPLGERPALLLRDIGEWRTVDRAAHAPHLYNDEDVALVLHAPGGPRLGMVRARKACDLSGLGDAYGDDITLARREEGWKGRAENERGEGYTWDVPAPPSGLDAVDVFGTSDEPAAPAFALAHLLHQRGLASEVLVLPVATPADAG